MFEWIEKYMEATGCDWDTAAREYDYEHNPDYSADDYDAPDYYGCLTPREMDLIYGPDPEDFI